MKVIISAGGTGGHIYPALAIINKIKSMEPDSEFLYIGTHNRMEKDLIPKLGIAGSPFINLYKYCASLTSIPFDWSSFLTFITANCFSVGVHLSCSEPGPVAVYLANR